MQITIYGIRNCSTMKKAFAWLEEHGLPYEFHDYEKAGVPEVALRQWVEKLGWEALINRRGTTWRRLTATEQDIADATAAIALMQTHPSVIRRPILEFGPQVLVGFAPDQWAAALG